MRSSFITAIYGLLVLLFLYTGVSKFINFGAFYFDINNQPFPNKLTPVLVWIIPTAEILVAIMLLFKPSQLIGLWASLVMMAIFTLYTALVLLHVFPYVPCGCGGFIRTLTWPQHLVFNLFIDAIIIVCLFLKRTQIRPNGSKVIFA